MVAVLVVGAGPAGLSTATTILEHDPSINVIIVDKKLKAGENPKCGGGINRFAIKFLRENNVPIPSEAILAKINCFRAYSPDLHYWDFKTDEILGYILNREVFERNLAKRVESLGAEFFWNYNITEEALGRLKLRFDYIVGCDGFPSVVGKWAGAPQPALCDIAHVIQKVVKHKQQPQNRLDIYFGSRYAKQGYAWVFPKGEDEIRMGLGVLLSLKLNVKALLDFFSYNVAYDLEEKELISRLLPLTKPRKTNVFCNGEVLLVGDAGLHIDPVSGAGIWQAVYAGKACGKAIAEGKPRNYDDYVRWLDGENRWGYRGKKLLVGLRDQEWNEIINKLNKENPVFTSSKGSALRTIAKWIMRKKPSLFWRFIRG